ncbi:MAG: hypothetical protein ABSE44_11200 [Candidatus Sulfotelmatobacter sp.]
MEEGNNYLYHAPNADSGWLRASLLTLKDTSRERLCDLLNERAEKHGGDFYESGGNIVVAWEQLSEEDGIPICNYWWAVAHYHSLNVAHEALFSYTIPRERLEDPETQLTLSLLAKLVADARFAEPKIA